jgi:hypothetical protein
VGNRGPRGAQVADHLDVDVEQRFGVDDFRQMER